MLVQDIWFEWTSMFGNIQPFVLAGLLRSNFTVKGTLSEESLNIAVVFIKPFLMELIVSLSNIDKWMVKADGSLNATLGQMADQ